MPPRRRPVGAVTPRRRRQQAWRLEENQANEGTAEVAAAAVPLPKAFSYSPVTFEYVCDIGTLSILCPHCNAQKFPRETQGMCCLNGKVDLHPHPQPPPDIVRLLRGERIVMFHFLQHKTDYISFCPTLPFPTTPSKPGYSASIYTKIIKVLCIL